MSKEQFKEPYKKLCGICYADMGVSNNPEGELSYDDCEGELSYDGCEEEVIEE